MKTVLGIIGGSGVYDLPGVSAGEWRRIASPWGEPSDDILFADADGLPLRFLPRHGRGHPLSPSGINYRANIDALKRAGVTDLVSVSAVGSLREDLPPGALVLVDQFVDRTIRPDRSFFGNGCVAHVALADPTSPGLVGEVADAAAKVKAPIRVGGTYVAIEGPNFSTRAESRQNQHLACDVVGMTGMPEARLVREAEICYASIAMVTDYDCWRPGPVDVPEIFRVMAANLDLVRSILGQLVAQMPRLHQACPIGSDQALEYALVTAPEKRDPALLAKLDAVAGRVLNR